MELYELGGKDCILIEESDILLEKQKQLSQTYRATFCGWSEQVLLFLSAWPNRSHEDILEIMLSRHIKIRLGYRTK
jgi:hypothetical protein